MIFGNLIPNSLLAECVDRLAFNILLSNAMMCIASE